MWLVLEKAGMKHGWTAQEMHSFICTFEGVQMPLQMGTGSRLSACR